MTWKLESKFTSPGRMHLQISFYELYLKVVEILLKSKMTLLC